MRSKLGMVWALAKRRPLFATIVALMVAMTMLVGVQSCGNDRGRAHAAARENGGSAPFETGLSAGDVHKNLAKGYGERVVGVEESVSGLRREIATLQDHLRQSEKDRADKDKALAELVALVKDARNGDAAAREEANRTPSSGPARLRAFDLAAPADGKRTVHIPAGSFGEATLLSGVYAPTTGEPLPVLIRLDAAAVGPSKSRVPLRGIFLVGKAKGDANSRRAVIQLDTLSLVKQDGAAVESAVNGWVVDADGIQGVRGTYVWRADEILTLSALAGGASSFADAFAAGETTQQMTPLGGVTTALTGNPLKFAGFRALGGMSEKIADAVAARIEEIQPAVYAANGGRITVVFLNGTTLDGLDVEETDGTYAGSRRPHRGLDAHK